MLCTLWIAARDTSRGALIATVLAVLTTASGAGVCGRAVEAYPAAAAVAVAAADGDAVGVVADGVFAGGAVGLAGLEGVVGEGGAEGERVELGGGDEGGDEGEEGEEEGGFHFWCSC